MSPVPTLNIANLTPSAVFPRRASGRSYACVLLGAHLSGSEQAGCVRLESRLALPHCTASYPGTKARSCNRSPDKQPHCWPGVPGEDQAWKVPGLS